MLNKLKKKIENNNYQNFTKIEIENNVLRISAKMFSENILMQELIEISQLVDKKVYNLSYLNDNIIEIKLRKDFKHLKER